MPFFITTYYVVQVGLDLGFFKVIKILPTMFKVYQLIKHKDWKPIIHICASLHVFKKIYVHVFNGSQFQTYKCAIGNNCVMMSIVLKFLSTINKKSSRLA